MHLFTFFNGVYYVPSSTAYNTPISTKYKRDNYFENMSKFYHIKLQNTESIHS